MKNVHANHKSNLYFCLAIKHIFTICCCCCCYFKKKSNEKLCFYSISWLCIISFRQWKTNFSSARMRDNASRQTSVLMHSRNGRAKPIAWPIISELLMFCCLFTIFFLKQKKDEKSAGTTNNFQQSILASDWKLWIYFWRILDWRQFHLAERYIAFLESKFKT